MSTTFWFPSGTIAAVSPVPSVWDHVNTVSRVLNTVKGTSALTTLTYTPDAGNDLTDKDAMIAQFVSEVFPPQTILAQSMILGVECFEALATNNLFMTWTVYLVDTPGTSVLATLVALQRDNTELVITTPTGEVDTFTCAETVVAVPFRVVCEIGVGGTPAVTGGHNGSMRFGEAALSGIQQGSTIGGTPRLEFGKSLRLTFLPAVGDVDLGVQFGAAGTEFTGTLVQPNVNDVQDGVNYGAGGTEFDGDLVIPLENQVESGVGFGADGTEFTGNGGTFGGGGNSVARGRR